VSERTTVLDYSAPAARLHHEPPTLFESLGEPGHAHHFQDRGQQKEAATLGMWLFLATEVLLFGGMFAAYFAYRHAYPTGWEAGSRRLNWWLGSVNTFILLSSSFCVAMAVHAGHAGNGKRIAQWLGVTIVFGFAFLGVKAVEYTADYNEKLIPWMGDFMKKETEEAEKIPAGGRVNAEELEHILELKKNDLPAEVIDKDGGLTREQVLVLIRHMKMFMLFYFIMTIIHASHMVAGISVMAVLAGMAWKGRFSSKWYTPVEMAGLYWHFVDVVWVFLLPALDFARPL
jgi:cytochrome c oxidase subunit 3